MSECPSCGQRAHNFATEEAVACVPPPDVLQFGNHTIDAEYRAALYAEYPFYTAEEVVGSFLGHNPHFPSQVDFWNEQLDPSCDADWEESDSESEESGLESGESDLESDLDS